MFILRPRVLYVARVPGGNPTSSTSPYNRLLRGGGHLTRFYPQPLYLSLRAANRYHTDSEPGRVCGLRLVLRRQP